MTTDDNETPPHKRAPRAPHAKAAHRGPAAKAGRPHHRAKGARPPHASRATAPEAATQVFGLHAAAFALRNPARIIRTVWATENAERRLGDALAGHEARVERVLPRDLDRRLGADTVHQGVLIDLDPPQPASLAELVGAAKAKGWPLIILDQVTDPHNVGAVLRSAAVFGAAGLIMTHRHSPPLGGALAKAASGALELTPIALVRNLADAITEIKTAGIFVIGLDGDGEHRLETGIAAHARNQTPAALALALGAEGKGLRALTRQSCDQLCRIGGDGPIRSLNVSNAAAVALHVAAMHRAPADGP